MAVTRAIHFEGEEFFYEILTDDNKFYLKDYLSMGREISSLLGEESFYPIHIFIAIINNNIKVTINNNSIDYIRLVNLYKLNSKEKVLPIYNNGIDSLRLIGFLKNFTLEEDNILISCKYMIEYLINLDPESRLIIKSYLTDA